MDDASLTQRLASLTSEELESRLQALRDEQRIICALIKELRRNERIRRAREERP